MRFAIQAESLEGGKDFRHAGVGRYSYMIVEHLLRIGDAHEWRLLVNPSFQVPEEWSSRPNFKSRPIGPKYRVWRAAIRTPYLLRHRIDALFVLTGYLCNHRLIRQACTVHDLFPFDHPEAFPDAKLGSMREIAAQQIRRADLLFAVSENTRRRICERFPAVPESRIVVTPNGPGNFATPVPKNHATPERLAELGVPFRRYFFTLGTLEPRKNLGRLIEALAILRRNRAFTDVGLAVGGGKGWKESSIFERVRELGLESAIAFLGYVPDEALPVLFAGAEAAVCASIDEGFGIPVLEAMLYGAPVLSSEAGALPEVGGTAARYFDPFSPESMAAAMASLLDGEFDRTAMIAAGRERAQAFTWEKTAEKTLQELERLAG